jgi:hypothetical protein
VVWQKRLGGAHYASSLCISPQGRGEIKRRDGRIYFFDDEGMTHVLGTGREAKILSRNRLDDGCMASPAVAGSSLFVRTKTHLYRIEEAKRIPIRPGPASDGK